MTEQDAALVGELRYTHEWGIFQAQEDVMLPSFEECADRIESLSAEVERLREALHFYARENSWKSCGIYMSGRPNPSSAEIDRGNKARAALEASHD